MHSNFVHNVMTVSRMALPASVLLPAASAAAASGAVRTAPLWLSAMLQSMESYAGVFPESDIRRVRESILQCIAAAAGSAGVDEAASVALACIRLAAATGGSMSRDELQCLLRICAGTQTAHRRRQAAWKGFVPVQAVLSPAAVAQQATRVALLKQVLIHGHQSGCINASDLPVLQVQAATMAVRLGAHTSALDLLALPSLPAVAPSVTLLNRLIDSQAGSAQPQTGHLLEQLRAHGHSPTRDTLHALLRVGLHSPCSRAGAAEAAHVLQGTMDSTGVQPGERSLGYAAFHAAKAGQWEQVQRIRTMARAARKQSGRTVATSRWETKLALYGRLHAKPE